jgi:hypothetical protein
MSRSTKTRSRNSGVRISSAIGSVGGSIIGGDSVAGDKITNGLTPDELVVALSRAIDPIKHLEGRFRKFETEKEKIFRKYIKPAFNELQPVIRTYEDDLIGLRTAMLANSVDAHSVVSNYIEGRRVVVRKRIKFVSALEATFEYWQRKIAENESSDANSKLIAFIDALRKYFLGSRFRFNRNRDGFSLELNDDAPSPSSIATSLIELLRVWEHSTDRGRLRLGIISTIDDAMRLLEQRNTVLQKSYSLLQMECEG